MELLLLILLTMRLDKPGWHQGPEVKTWETGLCAFAAKFTSRPRHTLRQAFKWWRATFKCLPFFRSGLSPKPNLFPILKLSLVAGFQGCILNIFPLIFTFHLAFFISFAHFALYLECHLAPDWNLQTSQRPSLSCLHSFILYWGRVKLHPLTRFQHPSVSDHVFLGVSPSVISSLSKVTQVHCHLTSSWHPCFNWSHYQDLGCAASLESLEVDNVSSYLTVAMSPWLRLFCWHRCANSY